MEKINGLDLFSGIGGISLALQPWVKTICYVEMDYYCQAVLMSRMRSGKLDNAPIWDDVQSFDAAPWIGSVDIISGGFPCQDISIAGTGKGLAGRQSGLFYQMAQIIYDVSPTFVFLENVPAILTKGRGGYEVIATLTAMGYDVRWGILSAYDVGASHIRERWWALAHTNSKRRKNSGGMHPSIHKQKEKKSPIKTSRNSRRWTNREWHLESRMGRIAHGVPFRTHKLIGLGNAVVPECAEEAFLRLLTGRQFIK